MQRFKNILMIAGGEGWESTGLKRAVALARNNSATLSILEVIEELPREMKMVITSMELENIQDEIIRQRYNELEQLIRPIRNEGIPVSAKVICGTPFLEIIREVLRNNHDLVIKTEQRPAGLKGLFFGSTSTHLMRKCPCPVWIIKPSQQKKFARILAAVDPDPYDKKRDAVNSRIMEIASSLAGIEGSELHLIHAWNLHLEKALLWRAGVSKADVERLGRKVRKEHKDMVSRLVEQYVPDMPDDKVHLLKGEAEELIPDLARTKKIDLLVMGTVCRTGIEGFFIGNTAEKVLQQVDCSVLTIKPDGFKTPVRIK